MQRTRGIFTGKQTHFKVNVRYRNLLVSDKQDSPIVLDSVRVSEEKVIRARRGRTNRGEKESEKRGREINVTECKREPQSARCIHMRREQAECHSIRAGLNMYVFVETQTRD